MIDNTINKVSTKICTRTIGNILFCNSNYKSLKMWCFCICNTCTETQQNVICTQHCTMYTTQCNLQFM